MKKRITAMLVTVAMVLCMMPTVSLAAGGDIYDDGMLKYEEESIYGSSLSVIGLSSTFSGHSVDIPSEFDGKPVIAINDEAFKNNNTIESVTIPASVLTIGSEAFEDCWNLSSVTLSEGLTTIFDNAFTACYALTDITIPASVTSCGSFSFANCGSLTHVELNDGLKDIGYGMFSACVALESITIPSSVKYIGEDAFYYCEKLSSVTLSEGLTKVGNSMFQDCKALKSVIMPKSLTSIDNQAFYNCSALEKIIIPGNSVTFGSDVFANTKLSTDGIHGVSGSTAQNYATNNSIPFTALSTDWEDGLFTYAPLPDDTLSITGYFGCGGTITIPSSYDSGTGSKAVTDIADGAFVDNRTIKSVTIPSSIITIGDAAFGSSSLSGVTLSSGLKTIGKYMFAECYNLKSITIPSSVTSIGDRAFADCDSLSSVTLSNGLKTIGSNMFESCGALESITIPSSVTSVGDEAFANCISLDGVTLSDGLTTIGNKMFYNCDGLTSITIPSSLTSIGETAFGGCPNLSNVTLSNGLTEIANSMFNTCEALTAITIPASVTSIGEYAFASCSNLGRVTLSEGLKNIGDSAFYATGLISITVPASVTTIGSGAFHDCYKLCSATLNNGLKEIEFMAFYGCDALTSVTIPSSVTTIGAQAFRACSKLKKATVSSKTASIDTEVFLYTDINSDGIYGYAGSTVQTYATANSIPFHAFQGTVSASANNAAYGTVSGFGAHDIDSSVTVKATPKAGYHFVRWTENGTQVSTGAEYTFTVTGDTTLVAVFEADPAPPPPPTIPVGISCSKTDATLFGTANGSITATATGGNNGRYEYNLNGGAWQSGNVFSGIAAGTHTVAVRDAGNPGNTASCSVSISQPPSVGNVAANKIPTKSNVGTAVTVVPPAAPKGYTTTSTTYTSSNPAIAAVDANGNVTFLAGGKVTITTKIVSTTVDKKGKVKTKTTTVKKTITVNQPVASISLNSTNASIAPKQKLKLSAVVAPATASNKKLTWKSSNPKVAVVSGAGLVTGKTAGTAVITCTAKDGSKVTISCTVTVK